MGKIKFLLIAVSFVLISASQVMASDPFSVGNTDNVDRLLFGFFDLRDRESFIQATNTDGLNNQTVHIQIFNVADNCNENDFFDVYTPNDTHVYNVRNIVTNDGNPSGVVLPDGAYGVFVVSVTGETNDPQFIQFIGNLRIEDNNGYEYRTNLIGTRYEEYDGTGRTDINIATFNFNNQSGIAFSDIILIPYSTISDVESPIEVDLSDVLGIWNLIDIDIFDLNENVFSCRNVIFSCVDQNSSLLEGLLEVVADASDGGSATVASFEYGINESIPHSKGGELLCPGNNISEGIVRFTEIEHFLNGIELVGFYGLNNGNGRGSIDAMIAQNSRTPFPGDN